MSTATVYRDIPVPESTKVPASSPGSENGKRGIELLRDPELNKSTAFTEAERQALGLVGLVPEVTESEDLQLRRVMKQLAEKNTSSSCCFTAP
jgi:hypothetical protein